MEFSRLRDHRTLKIQHSRRRIAPDVLNADFIVTLLLYHRCDLRLETIVRNKDESLGVLTMGVLAIRRRLGYCMACLARERAHASAY